MQHLKNFNWKKFLLQGVLPCLLAVAVGFISRYQLELSDGVTESFLQLQWPLYAPLNALTAFCLTLILFALLGKWSRATGISGAVFTLIALINYYTRDLHGSALMPQDILNLGTAAEVMGSYTLKITQDVVKIVLLYLPILAIVFVQAQLVKGAPKRAGWKARGVRAAGSALGVFLVMFFGYFGPVTIKPKTTYGWAWQNTYYTYGYLAGTIEATSLMADPVIEPENYNDAAAVNTARKADDYTAPASPESAEDYPDIVLILSESFYDFDLVTDLQADTDIMPVTKNLPNSVYGHTISPHVGGGTNSTEYEMLTSNSLILMPSITPFNWLNLYNANSVVSYLKGLGYSTMAAHPYTISNCRRDSAWLALGFDAINRERTQGTLNRLVSQPIHRDAVINAKFLAGTTVVFIMIFFVGIMVGGLGLAILGIPPVGEELLRIFSYLLLTAVYTALWLGVSILCSTLCKHAATSALIVIAVWIYLTLFASMVVSIIANIAYPLDGIQGYYNMYSNYELQLSLERTSPYYLYCEAASTLLNPNVRTIGITTQASVSGAIASYLSFDQSLLLVWPHLTVMLALTMAAFTVSYIAFMRQEIRA